MLYSIIMPHDTKVKKWQKATNNSVYDRQFEGLMGTITSLFLYCFFLNVKFFCEK